MRIGFGVKPALVLAFGVFLLVAYLGLPPAEETQPEFGVVEPVLSLQREFQPDVHTGSNAAVPDEMLAEAQALVPGEEISVLGQFMRVRELREESGDFSEGAIRNLEFVFRPGILPRRLFPDEKSLIVNYRQLYHNSVGYGAATQFFLYELVSRDSDGDGLLTLLDRLDVAVSRPDGSGYRVLDRDLEAVLGVEHFSAENVLQLELMEGGLRVSREYLLPANN